ncbi:MAG: B12-binding domain-containing radical SAM protein [Deltaproteobacteria bacterium]|nr:B12-binding domain-containing radical SAM protein [Deltaproteobacteria bacterium]
MSSTPHILLINPYIWDFTAFDLWAKPLGLLYLAGALRANEYQVHLLDCLDVHFKGTEPPDSLPPRKIFGTGKYFRQRLAKPPALLEIPKYYYRYGVPPAVFLQALKDLPPPQAVLMTSSMTYWYGGVIETVELVRSVFPETPIILGGIYATLMPDHAQKTVNPNYLITGPGEGAILKLLDSITGQTSRHPPDPADLDGYPLPAFDLYPCLDYVCLMTSRGCPFSCPYCASKILQPGFRRRSVEGVVNEITYWHRSKGILDFAFYDDALLISFENHLGPVLEALLRQNRPLRFHTPNALHVREINLERAQLLYKAGFKTLRLGLETTNWERQKSWGGKMGQEDFYRAVSSLRKAGFEKNQIEAYLLIGLPGQTLPEIEQTIREVKTLGLRPRLAEYSPLPQTALWEEACRSSRFPLLEDPLFHNNSLLPCLTPFSWETVQALKDTARV